ncbi:MAG: hypothetical protein FIB00_05780, partial [Chloroflexi bacterium]|nr:hypothetical protein [Chloroflexota bacterium]
MTRREFGEVLISSAIAGAWLDPRALAAAAGISMEQAGADLLFVSGSTAIARLPAIAEGVASAVAEVNFAAVGASRSVRTFRSGSWEVSDQVRLLKEGFYEWQRTWKNRSTDTVQADLCMEIESGYAPEFTLIPGISYNGNPEYGRRAPKGLSADGKPWVFSAFRSNIPAGSYSEGGDWSIFLFTAVDRASLFCALSLEERNRKLAHRLLWPERDNIRPGAATEHLAVAPGEAFTVMAYVVLTPVQKKRRSFSAGMDHAWRLNRHDVKPSFPPRRCWELGTQFARESLWYDNDDEKVKFTGFCFGMSAPTFDATPGPEGFKNYPVFSAFGSFDIGWCNQNAEWGVVMLQDY